MTAPTATIGTVSVGDGSFVLIAGPCMAESSELCHRVARHLQDLCADLGIGYVFKASFDKANRTSVGTERGPGMETGLAWLAEVREDVGVPVLTDIHEPHQADPAARAVDAVQIPAFLCRQTDLLLAAGQTGLCVNIKKGQFMAPADMAHAVGKIHSTGNQNVLLTDRGVSFGYNNLVSDMRSIPVMQEFAPVVFDATHSTQEPGGQGSQSGGQRRFVRTLALAAIAAGADALFLETHPDPEHAKSDAATQLPLDEMEVLLKQALAIFRILRQN